MFSFCSAPESLNNWYWFSCYLTTNVHMSFYLAVLKVLLLLALTAPAALAFGFLGATAARSPRLPVRWIGKAYISIVRGIPDIVFFLFFVIALDQLIEYARHRILCPDWVGSVRQGNDFIVCLAAKMPPNSAAEWQHQVYGFGLAVFTFAVVFGAFAANILFGAMRSVAVGQIEAAKAYAMTRRQTFWRVIVPQMWVYALPGLSNLWMGLIKATPLLFLLGIKDIVYWARELGGIKTQQFTAYPHSDWRMWYFLALMVLYLIFTQVSEKVFNKLMRRLNRGQATSGGMASRKVAP